MRASLHLAAIAGAALLVSAPPLAAWDDLGHQVVAEIAWRELSPASREAAAGLLAAAPPGSGLATLADGRKAGGSGQRRHRHFVLAATWADLVKRAEDEEMKRYNRSWWHYVNRFWEQNRDGIYHDRPDIPLPREHLVSILERLTARLGDASRPAAERAIDLAWILHLYGDLHQPLHNSSRITGREPEGDRGGNLFLLDDDDNLHRAWDQILSRSFKRRAWENDGQFVGRLADRLTKQWPRRRFAADLATTPEALTAWSLAGYEARLLVYNRDLERGKPLPEGYRERMLYYASRAIPLAGYRLAAYLDAALVGNHGPAPR